MPPLCIVDHESLRFEDSNSADNIVDDNAAYERGNAVNRTTAISGIAVIVVIVLIGVGVWLGPSAYRLMASHTTGSIFVSGPQVYTRERLVNDRYREDAWLLGELDNSGKLSFGATASLARMSSYTGILSGGVGTGNLVPAANDAKPARDAADDAKPARDAAKPSAPAVDVTPFERFRALLTYREQIRTLIIENQLDDRHDLRGNSLYRLRFDAAVLPGNNTNASAKITVSVLPPDGLLSQSVTNSNSNKDLRDEELKLATLTNFSNLTKNEQGVSEESLLQMVELARKAFRRWAQVAANRMTQIGSRQMTMSGF